MVEYHNARHGQRSFKAVSKVANIAFVCSDKHTNTCAHAQTERIKEANRRGEAKLSIEKNRRSTERNKEREGNWGLITFYSPISTSSHIFEEIK